MRIKKNCGFESDGNVALADLESAMEGEKNGVVR
jgi:hypothetical protein